jgi:transcriptional regulator with XRE-family HTH domain
MIGAVNFARTETRSHGELYSMSESDFAGLFVARRQKLGVSQEAFADLCGLDRTYMGGVERGERNLSLINIEKIAVAFEVPLSELFRGV